MSEAQDLPAAEPAEASDTATPAPVRKERAETAGGQKAKKDQGGTEEVPIPIEITRPEPVVAIKPIPTIAGKVQVAAKPAEHEECGAMPAEAPIVAVKIQAVLKPGEREENGATPVETAAVPIQTHKVTEGHVPQPRPRTDRLQAESPAPHIEKTHGDQKPQEAPVPLKAAEPAHDTGTSKVPSAPSAHEKEQTSDDVKPVQAAAIQAPAGVVVQPRGGSVSTKQSDNSTDKTVGPVGTVGAPATPPAISAKDALKGLMAQAPALRRSVEEQSFTAQASRGLTAALKQGEGTVTLRLQPTHLGSLKVHITMQDSAVSAKIEPTNASARQLLLDSESSLRAALEARGLSVERIEVETVSPPPHLQHATDNIAAPEAPGARDSGVSPDHRGGEQAGSGRNWDQSGAEAHTGGSGEVGSEDALSGVGDVPGLGAVTYTLGSSGVYQLHINAVA
jgi:flagellar hook-length control protein FliK